MSTQTPLRENKRDRILMKIIDSRINNPKMTEEERRDAHMRIAKQEKINLMVVAGIASNFTRGRYGKPTTLISRRKKVHAAALVAQGA